jgi:hypothetical protein
MLLADCFARILIRMDPHRTKYLFAIKIHANIRFCRADIRKKNLCISFVCVFPRNWTI